MKRDEPASLSVEGGKNLTFDGRLSCFRHPDVSKARVADVDGLVCVVCEAQWAVWAHAEVARLQAQVDAMDEVFEAAKEVVADRALSSAVGADYVVGKTALDSLETALARLDASP